MFIVPPMALRPGYDATMTPRLLYLLRHAIAQDKALPITDADRTLTPKGRRQMRQVAAFCKRQQLVPRLFLSSPVVRARQTAEALANQLPGCGPLLLVDWLRNDTPTDTALAGLHAVLAQQPGDPWLVGHEPDLSALLAALIEAPPGAVLLKKASLSCLQLPDAGPAQLLWTLPCQRMD